MWLEAISPQEDFTVRFEIIDLNPAILQESNVFFAAVESKQEKIQIVCTDTLTMRAFFKVVEYCMNYAAVQSLVRSKEKQSREQDQDNLPKMNVNVNAILGIFGSAFKKEVWILANYLDLNILASFSTDP